MKVKLLKKLRDKCVIFERNKTYRFVCVIREGLEGWKVDSGWVDDKQLCIDLKRETILDMARKNIRPKNIID